MVSTMFVWASLSVFVSKRVWFFINIALIPVAVYGILRYTVLGRTYSDIHRMVMFASYSDEFVREMIMNAFLYFPLGLTLTNVTKKFWLSIGIGLFMSL